MSLEFSFIFPLPHGLHARPASHFQATANRFHSTISLIAERSGYTANSKSVLSLVGAGVMQGDPCRLVITGDDEAAALKAMKAFVSDVLPKSDDALPASSAEGARTGPLPRSLLATRTQCLRGQGVSEGVGRGGAVVIGHTSSPADLGPTEATNIAGEQGKVAAAIASVANALDERVAAATHPQEADVLRAHSSIARDVALAEKIDNLIVHHRFPAARAIVQASEDFSHALRESPSEYLRERVVDVSDVSSQLVDAVLGRAPAGTLPSEAELNAPWVCVADHLSPGQFLAMKRGYLRGLVLGDGGTTSHTVILARSLAIPTVVDLPDAVARIRSGQEVIVDGGLGVVIPEPNEAVQRYYQVEERHRATRRGRLDLAKRSAARTADGFAIEVGANVASDAEVSPAVEMGAEGVGLFRTEMLFLDRETPPSEDEQTAIYSEAARAAGGRTVIIRLLDIGGDKPAPYLHLPVEENPYLGYRGVRLYADFPALLLAQLRAVLRASAHGNIKIMVPMISCLEEVRQAKAMLAQAAKDLAAAGRPCEQMPQMGIMIEVPSTAMIMPELCAEADFFSIGSNDLTQYTLAADRGNPKVAGLYAWSHPSFLRLLKKIVDEAKACGRWIGLCGEMGESQAALPLLVGLGLDEISMAAPRIAATKAALSALHRQSCVALLEAALRCSTRAQVDALTQGVSAAADVPLLSSDLIFASPARTKEEAIKDLCDALYAAGRLEKPRALEEAVWRREETYSTGFGHGFAVPHCKSDVLVASSIAIAKLATPVEWKSLDGEPVDVVFLLALREQDAKQHLRIFSRLSRLVMRDEFRARVRELDQPEQLAAFLRESLNPPSNDA